MRDFTVRLLDDGTVLLQGRDDASGVVESSPETQIDPEDPGLVAAITDAFQNFFPPP